MNHATKVSAGNRQHGRNKPTSYLVRQRLNRRATALGLRNQTHNLREHGFAADALGLHHDAAGGVHRAAGNFCANDLLHW
jgi:hypothetical protein